MSELPIGSLERTALHSLHVELGAKLVPFAGYDMPVQYPTGIIAEHNHTRAHASLFDVSHMGQLTVQGDGAASALEALVPGDVMGLGPGRLRYTFFTNDQGGILDDLMITNVGDYFFVIVNAARKHADLAHLQAALAGKAAVESLGDRSLLALQGPAAAAVMARLAPGAESLRFMNAAPFVIDGSRLALSRSGYTGEDGFEISVPTKDVERIARLILAQDEVWPAGLGARDSLRLEAGLCLYGHDIDETTTPIEAALEWTIAKRRRRDGGYPGDAIIARQLAEGAPRHRVGILPAGKVPAREHTEITGPQGAVIGVVTSGGFGPTLGGPLAMGYVGRAHSAEGTEVELVVRGTARAARVAAMPFAPHRYFKG